MSSGSEMLFARVKAATDGEYTLERELGRGGMAAVFLARDTSLERRVAIKVMLPDLVDVEGLQDRFVVEARTSAHLDHPGIVTVYSVKQREGLLFIVMKYIEGRTLDAVLKDDARLSVPVVASIIGQVAEALHFAHGEGIVHRDVKPSNILIDKRGRPVVTDFGIAKVTSARSVTVTGAMIGTPAYMSPEQCRGLPATTASDQYSLGVMMYEMLAGRAPFTGESIFELIHSHCNEPPPPLGDQVSGIPKAVEEAVMRMLAKNPRERWDSLADVSRFLAKAVPEDRRSGEVRANIAALAAEPETERTLLRRPNVAYDLSGAQTEVATTPARALVITPDDPAIETGETLQLRVSESSGASLSGVRITWKSEDATVASVDEQGRATGRAVGLAKITATGGAAFGRSTVTVRAPRVDTLVITPQSPELIADNELQFVATALDARGNVLTGQPLVWTSSDVSVCAVSQQGRAIGVSSGRATVTAIIGNVSGTASVKVRPPAVERVVVEPGEASIEVEASQRLTAIAFGPLDRRLAGRTVTWRSSVPTVAAVSADGTISGIAAGTAAILATCEGKEGLASVSVRSQPVIAVRIQPERLQLEVGRSLQLKGLGEDRRGRPVPGRGLEWQSDDDQVALVDASGKVHAVGAGRTTVRAVADDAASAIEVVVVPRAAAQIRIGAHPPMLAIGEVVPLDATVLDAEGATLADRPLEWTSSDAAVVAVNAAGVCEARKAGGVRIGVVCESVKASTKLSVRAPAAAPKPQPGRAAGTAGAAEATLASEAARASAPTVQVPARPIAAAARPATPPAHWKRSRALPVGVAVVALASAGLWAATRGGGMRGTTSPPAAAAPFAARADSAPASGQKQPLESPRGGDLSAPSSVGAQAAERGAAAPVGVSRGSPAAVGPVTAAPSPSEKRASDAAASSGGARGGEAKVADAQAAQRTADTRTDTKTEATKAAETKAAETRLAPATQSPPAPPATAKGEPPTASPPTGQPIAAATAPPTADRPADADRALLCGNLSAAESALSDALAADPAAGLSALYLPRDPADSKAKESLLSQLKEVTRLRVTARGVRNEPAGDGCAWVMTLDFSYSNAFGQARRKSGQVRLQLEATAGRARAKRIFGATGF